MSPRRSQESIRRRFQRKSPDEEIIDFQKDATSEMTYGRRIALSLIDKTWYNPGAIPQSKEEEEQYRQAQIEARNYDSERNVAEFSTGDKPSLEKAWAYFEHVALSRYILKEKPDGPKKNICTRIVRKYSKANKKLERAEPGERNLKTKLYDPIFTPHNQVRYIKKGFDISKLCETLQIRISRSLLHICAILIGIISATCFTRTLF